MKTSYIPGFRAPQEYEDILDAWARQYAPIWGGRGNRSWVLRRLIDVARENPALFFETPGASEHQQEQAQ